VTTVSGTGAVRGVWGWVAWVVEGLLLLAAGVAMLAFGLISTGVTAYLPSVDTIDLEVRQPTYQGNSWAWWIAAWSLAMIVSTGRPRLHESSSFWSARGSAGGAVAQAIAGLIAIGGTGLAAVLFNSGPLDPEIICAHVTDGCWPRQAQLYVDLAPGVLGGVAMLVMACLVVNLPWWIRAVTPALLWVGVLGVEYLLWDSYLMPIFEGQPW
jgi:hypothetical protein